MREVELIQMPHYYNVNINARMHRQQIDSVPAAVLRNIIRGIIHTHVLPQSLAQTQY